MKIIYARGNYIKQPQFRLKTTIYCTDDGYIVRKQAQTAASVAHIQHLIDNEKRFETLFPYYSFVPIHDTGTDYIDYNYFPEPNLEKRIEEALIHRAFNTVFELFQTGMNMIDKMPSKQHDPYTSPEFSALFDPEKQWATQKDEACVNPVLFDMNFDNLIARTPDDIWIIDREWFFTFPVPIAFLKFSSTFYLASTVQFLLQTYVCKEFPLIEVYKGTFIPESWLSYINLDYQDLPRFATYLIQFQNTVNWQTVPPDTLEIVEDRVPLTSRPENRVLKDIGSTMIVLNQAAYINKASKRNSQRYKELTQQISQVENDIRDLEAGIRQITDSKFYRIARLFKLM
jgi:hypothetical protein